MHEITRSNASIYVQVSRGQRGAAISWQMPLLSLACSQMIRRSGSVVLLSGLAVMGLLSSASAESGVGAAAHPAAHPAAKQGNVAAARAAADEGYAAFQAQDYERALALFQRANEFFDAPTHWLYVARTQVNLGRLQAAAETYRQVAETPLPPKASAAFHRAREDAAAELSALQPRLPRLTIAIEGPVEASVQVTRNGQTVPTSALGESISVDPGEHELEAVGEAVTCTSQVVRVREGENQRVVLSCTRVNPGQTVVSSPVSQSVSQPASQGGTETDDGRSVRVAGWVAIGVGIAGIAGGVPLLIVGLKHRSAASDHSEACEQPCSAEEQRWIRDTHSRGNAFVVGGLVSMGVGALSGVIGEVLLRSSSNREKSGGVHVEPWITVDRVGLTGRF